MSEYRRIDRTRTREARANARNRRNLAAAKRTYVPLTIGGVDLRDRVSFTR